MRTFKKADSAIADLGAEIIEKHHAELEGLVVDYIMAYPSYDDEGEPTGPAIAHNGYPALGLCRIIGLKDRVMGRGDVEILLDGDRWPDLSKETQLALIDHELTHVELKRDKEERICMDDLNRPLIKMRKHDRQFGWFDSIASRYGSHSFEVKQFVSLEEAGQIYFGFMLPARKDFQEVSQSEAFRRFQKVLGDNNVTLSEVK